MKNNPIYMQTKRIIMTIVIIFMGICVADIKAYAGTFNASNLYSVPTRTLYGGYEGDDVKWVQMCLNDIENAGLAVDGNYGSNSNSLGVSDGVLSNCSETAKAVRRFQDRFKLTVDGIAGTNTINKMVECWGPDGSGTGTDMIVGLSLPYTGNVSYVKNTGSNVELCKMNSSEKSKYYWICHRLSDNTYTFKSAYDGKMLDVQGAGTSQGTNVFVSDYNGNENQRWYLCGRKYGNDYFVFRLVPKGKNSNEVHLSLDVEKKGTADGTNIQVWGRSQTDAQVFKLQYCALNESNYSATEITSLKISNGNQTLVKGNSKSLSVTLNPSNTICNSIIWSSSNTNIATVDANGKVTAKAIGSATITATSRYNNTIKNSITVTVTTPISDATISGVNSNYTYTGSAIKPTPAVTYNNSKLTSGTHYTVSYSNNVNVGTATITITGKGNYTGTTTKTFKIDAVNVSSATVTGINTTYTYTGSTITPVPTVKYGNTTLASGTDYTVSYSNNVNEGTATVTITGKGNYTGTINKTFVIEKPVEENTGTSEESDNGNKTGTSEADTKKDNTSEEPAKPVQQDTTGNTTNIEDKRPDSNTTVVPATTESTRVIEKTTAGVVTIILDGDEENDSQETYNESVNGKNKSYAKKGEVLEGKTGKYKITSIKKNEVTYTAPNSTSIKNVTIPETVDYKNKTYKVTSIANGAFKNNKKLTKVVVGGNVRKIGKNAFRGCKKLKSVTIGKNVTTIGAYAFYGDRKLTEVNFKTKKLNKVDKAAFKKIGKHPKARVPSGTLEKYKKLIKKAS